MEQEAGLQTQIKGYLSKMELKSKRLDRGTLLSIVQVEQEQQQTMESKLMELMEVSFPQRMV